MGIRRGESDHVEDENGGKESASERGVIPSNRSLFSLGLRLTLDSLKLESPQESQRCRPMRFGILERFQATFE